jgi:hypothetical protein
MEEQIAMGDVVRFKGGGSSMTVEKIEGNEAICVFSLGGKQRLKLDVLEKVPDEPLWWDRGWGGRVAVTRATDYLDSPKPKSPSRETPGGANTRPGTFAEPALAPREES